MNRRRLRPRSPSRGGPDRAGEPSHVDDPLDDRADVQPSITPLRGAVQAVPGIPVDLVLLLEAPEALGEGRGGEPRLGLQLVESPSLRVPPQARQYPGLAVLPGLPRGLPNPAAWHLEPLQKAIVLFIEPYI